MVLRVILEPIRKKPALGRWADSALAECLTWPQVAINRHGKIRCCLRIANQMMVGNPGGGQGRLTRVKKRAGIVCEFRPGNWEATSDSANQSSPRRVPFMPRPNCSENSTSFPFRATRFMTCAPDLNHSDGSILTVSAWLPGITSGGDIC